MLVREDVNISHEEISFEHKYRSPFWLRTMRLVTTISILLICVWIFLESWLDYYFYNQCEYRRHCEADCLSNGFPANCAVQSSISVIYNGNQYSGLYKFTDDGSSEFQTCAARVNENPGFDFSGASQYRIHTCFNYCKQVCFTLSQSEQGFTQDNRPTSCTGADQTALLCVHFSDTCQYTGSSQEVILSGSGKNRLSFNPWMGLLAVVVANIIQLGFELLYICQSRQVVGQNPTCSRAFTKCFFQLLLVTISTTLITFAIVLTATTHVQGRPKYLWMTFFFALLIDQIKSVGLLFLAWYLLLRRCGLLQVTQEQKNELEIQADKKEVLILTIQKWIMKFLEHRITEISSFVLIMVYTVFILVWLSFDSMLPGSAQTVMEIIDLVFLVVFIVEIALKTFASSFAYLFDIWNLFDAVIVITSFILSFFIQAKGIAVLRLIRAVVMTLRAIAGKKLRFRHQALEKNALPAMKAIISRLLENEAIPGRMKRQLRWAVSTIDNQTLYKFKRDGDLDVAETIDPEAKEWMILGSAQANNVVSWFDKDLDDILHEIHRESDEFNTNKLIEQDYMFVTQTHKSKDDVRPKGKNHHESAYAFAPKLTSKQFLYATKAFQKLSAWDFDTLSYVEVLGDQCLQHFGFKLFAAYGLLEKFQVKDKNFMRLLNKIKTSFYTSSPFSNIKKAIDTTRTIHFFLSKGRLLPHLSDVYVLTLLLAGLLHDLAHPGLDAEFLIMTRHEKAVRYNDRSVLEKHHLAIAFKILHDSQCDIFENMSEAQYWTIREALIDTVLATDITYHFNHINEWKKSQELRDFPEDIPEDKQRLMSMSLYVADHSFAAKPLQQYIKWMHLMTEEIFLQGDLERKQGYFVQPTYDRTTANPFVYWKGYIEVIVEPLLTLWCDFLPDLQEDMIEKGLNNNKKEVDDKMQETMYMTNQPQIFLSLKRPRI